MTMKHKARIQIIHQILETLESCPNSCCPKTRLLYATGLNSRALRPYLEVLVANDLVEIRGPTSEQFRKRPGVRIWVISKRRAEIFLRLYDQSRREDLVWWESEEPKSNRPMSNPLEKSRTPSC